VARYVSCKKGLHDYSQVSSIGGGIARRTCSVCGVVQIDLRDESTVSDSNLFTEPKLATMFRVEALLAKVGEESKAERRQFGQTPSRRRRPVRAFG